MFQVVLLGLAATAAALPVVREAAKDNEGVSLPIYKPWYNAYSKYIYGSQYDKFFPNYNYFGDRRFSQDNYGTTNISPFAYRLNYFSKYLRPEMMYMNFYKFLDSFQNMRNPYHSNIFGYMSDFMRYPFNNNVNNYDYMNGPYSNEHMYSNIENFQNNDLSYSTDYSNFKYRPYSPEYIYGFMRNYMNMNYPYNYENNIYDYKYGPYSNEYMYENMKNFKNQLYPFFDKEYKYFNYPESTNSKNTYLPYHNYMNKFDYSYRPYSSETSYPFYNHMHDYDYMHGPYSTQYMNIKNKFYPFQNNVDSGDYIHRPYFSGYPQNFVDMSYPSNNGHGYSYTSWPNYSEYLNFKNSHYPFQNNMNSFDYKFRPYSPDYMYGHMQNFNMRYPYYNKFNGLENMYGYKNNYMNMEYPFYNNYFGKMNKAPYEFSEYMDGMRFKRESPQNVGSEEHSGSEQVIRQGGPAVAAHDAELVDHPVPKYRRELVESGVVGDRRQQVLESGFEEPVAPQYSRDTVPEQVRNNLNVEHHGRQILPAPDSFVDDRIPEVGRDTAPHQYPAHHQPSETDHARKTRGILVYPTARYHYPYYTSDPLYRTYTQLPLPPYQPLWYNPLYYKK